jgi:hypothetical protein
MLSVKAAATALAVTACAALVATSPVQGEPMGKAAKTCEGEQATIVGKDGNDNATENDCERIQSADEV